MSRESSPLIIVGAGAAGIACALTAARGGTQVTLLERSQRLGGTVTHSLIHTLGGLFDDQGEYINPGLPVELSERLQEASSRTCKRAIGKTWVLNVDPAIYEQTIARWLNEQVGLSIYNNTEVSRLKVNEGHIERISFQHKGQQHSLPVQAVIDASGNAAVIRHLDAESVSEGGVLAGFILSLKQVTPGALQFPKGVALLNRVRKAVDNQDLPPECANLWFDSGVYQDEIYIKFNLIASDYDSVHMTEVSRQLVTWLRNIPPFSQSRLAVRGTLGIRDGGRVRGDYCLTEEDILTGHNFADAVCRAAWPIEHWHPQQGVTLDYLPAGHRYSIPRRALSVRGFDNLFVAGKCLSATPRAQASARVVGSCWAMGEGLVSSLLS